MANSKRSPIYLQ